MGNNIATSWSRALAVTLLASSFALVACTKKDDVGTVKIIMPAAITTSKALQSAQSQSVSASSDQGSGVSWNTTLNPSTGSDINCYAVFIGGGDLNGNSCSVGSSSLNASTITFGPNIGFVPAGSEISLTTTSGQRTIYVVGLRATSATACRSYINYAPDGGNLSEPFLIAAQSAMIPAGTSSLNVKAALDTNKKITDCKFIGGGRGGATAAPFGDITDGGYLVTGTANLTAAASVLNAVSRTGTGTQPDTKKFAASRRVVAIATGGTDPGAALTLGSSFTANEFAVGDEVAWYVAGGNSSTGSPDDSVNGACGGGFYLGLYGVARIKTVASANQLVLDRTISGTPATIRVPNLAAAPTTLNYCTIVLSRVSNFDRITVQTGKTMTINAEPFNYVNGTGGFLMIRADQLVVEASATLAISGQGGGYGGSGTGGAAVFLNQGDGLTGAGTISTSPNFNGGAGGTGSMGGGGGANAGGGGAGSNNPLSESSLISSCSGICKPLVDQKTFMGGGGGASNLYYGGAGGAVVLVYARSIIGSGSISITSSGGAGAPGGAAGAGGGAGGSVGVYAKIATVSNLALSAVGGGGGPGTLPGSGGSGGVVNYSSCGVLSSVVAGVNISGGPAGYAVGQSGVSLVQADPSICLQQ